MEPFSITCTTCQARLRVRDESAIGQILACPKCGSMVLVETLGTTTERPGASSDTTPPPSAGSPPDPEALHPAESGPSGPPQAPENSENSERGEHPDFEERAEQEAASAGHTRSSRPTRTFKFREDFEVPEEPADGKRPRRPTTPAPPKQSADFATETELSVDRPVADDSWIPPDAATNPATRRYQQWLLIGAAALLGLILAVLMVGIFALRNSGSETAGVESSHGPAAGKNDASASPKTNGPTSTRDKGADAKKDAQGMNKQDVGEKPVPDSEKSIDLNGSPEPSDLEPKADDKEKDKDTAGSKDARAKPAAKEGSGSESGNKTSTDPSDQADGKLPPAPAPDSGAENNGADGKAIVLPPSMEPPDPTSTAATKPKSDLPAPDAVPEMTEAETRERLSTTIVAVEYSRIPLADFAEFISKLTAVPVTLDVDALPPLGITTDTPLAVDLRGVTIEEILRTALEPVRLAHAVKPGHILITADEPLRENPSTRTYDVTDLAGDAEEAASLAAHITSLIATGSWEREGGDATLSVKQKSLEIEQTEMVHFRIARFLDRLRAARGLPPRGDLPAEWLEIAPAFVRAAAELNAPLRAIFIQPTPLGTIMDYIETQTNLRILADWRALGELNLTPWFSQSVKLREQPFHELLDSWLAPMKLGYRVLDAHTVQISSRAAIAARPELELYPLKGEWDDENEELLADIKAHVGTSFFSQAEGQGAIAYDSVSNSLLVSLPQPQQRTVFAWLREREKLDFGANGTGDETGE